MALKKLLPLAFVLQSMAYDSIDEALKNGITQGEVGLLANYLKPNYDEAIYNMQNAYYNAVTMGIHYRSAFYKNMRLSVGFQAAYPLWQWHKNSTWGYSTGENNYIKKGDMSLDFDPFYRVLLRDTYLEYFDGDTDIKIGRFYVENEWASNQMDGLWIRNRSLESLMLEFYWIQQYAEITPIKMTALTQPHRSGYFYTAVKYYFEDIFWSKFYMFSSYSIAFGMGVSANAEYKFSSSKVGLTLNSARSFEFANGAKWLDEGRSILGGDGIDFDIKAYIESKLSNVSLGFNLGYIRSGKYSGWGSLNRLNDTISPLGIGNVFKEGILDTSLFYGTLYAKIDAIDIALLYGSASFLKQALATNRYRQNEVDLIMSFHFSDNVSAFLNLYNTHLGDHAIPNATQFQTGLTLSF